MMPYGEGTNPSPLPQGGTALWHHLLPEFMLWHDFFICPILLASLLHWFLLEETSQ